MVLAWNFYNDINPIEEKTLDSKLEVLEARKNLQQKFQSLEFKSGQVNNVDRLQDQVLKLETQLEAFDQPSNVPMWICPQCLRTRSPDPWLKIIITFRHGAIKNNTPCIK